MAELTIPDDVKAMTDKELLTAALQALDDLAHKAYYADIIGHSEYCDIGQLVQTAQVCLDSQPQAPQPPETWQPVERVSDGDSTITTRPDTEQGGTWIAVASDGMAVYALHVAGDVRLCKRGDA